MIVGQGLTQTSQERSTLPVEKTVWSLGTLARILVRILARILARILVRILVRILCHTLMCFSYRILHWGLVSW